LVSHRRLVSRRRLPRALAALGRYSLVTVTKDTITVHRLVQAVVREGLDQPTRQRWALTRAGRFLQARDNVRRRLARSNRLTGKA
jgi:hypothetical protein